MKQVIIKFAIVVTISVILLYSGLFFASVLSQYNKVDTDTLSLLEHTNYLFKTASYFILAVIGVIGSILNFILSFVGGYYKRYVKIFTIVWI